MLDYNVNIDVTDRENGWTEVKVTMRPEREVYTGAVVVDHGIYPSASTSDVIHGALKRAHTYAVTIALSALDGGALLEMEGEANN